MRRLKRLIEGLSGSESGASAYARFLANAAPLWRNVGAEKSERRPRRWQIAMPELRARLPESSARSAGLLSDSADWDGIPIPSASEVQRAELRDQQSAALFAAQDAVEGGAPSLGRFAFKTSDLAR
jgi:hypothetical protein